MTNLHMQNNYSTATQIAKKSYAKVGIKLSTTVPKCHQKLVTKRNVPSYVASIYDPLLPSCGSFLRTTIKFEEWASDISSIKTEILRYIPLKRESVTTIDLHLFGDASVIANCAAVYALIYQPHSIS